MTTSQPGPAAGTAASPDRPQPVPWATGLTATTFSALLTVTAIITFGIALAGIHPALAFFINVVGVGGAAPTVWGWRGLPTVRWVVYGFFAGVLAGWICLAIAGAAAVIS